MVEISANLLSYILGLLLLPYDFARTMIWSSATKLRIDVQRSWVHGYRNADCGTAIEPLVETDYLGESH